MEHESPTSSSGASAYSLAPCSMIDICQRTPELAYLGWSYRPLCKLIKYQDEIVKSYAGTVSTGFLLLHDNKQPIVTKVCRQTVQELTDALIQGVWEEIPENNISSGACSDFGQSVYIHVGAKHYCDEIHAS